MWFHIPLIVIFMCAAHEPVHNNGCKPSLPPPPPSIPHTKWCLFSEASKESCTQQTHIMFASVSNNFFLSTLQ